MKYTSIFAATTLLSISAEAGAQHWIGSRIRNEMDCEQREKPLVLHMGYKRDQGTEQEKFVAILEPLRGEERHISISRVEDVYLDPALKAETISAYRVERCRRGFDLREYAPFRELTRERLLQCQTLGGPGTAPFRDCVDGLLHALEESVAEMAEKPGKP